VIRAKDETIIAQAAEIATLREQVEWLEERQQYLDGAVDEVAEFSVVESTPADTAAFDAGPLPAAVPSGSGEGANGTLLVVEPAVVSETAPVQPIVSEPVAAQPVAPVQPPPPPVAPEPVAAQPVAPVQPPPPPVAPEPVAVQPVAAQPVPPTQPAVATAVAAEPVTVQAAASQPFPPEPPRFDPGSNGASGPAESPAVHQIAEQPVYEAVPAPVGSPGDGTGADVRNLPPPPLQAPPAPQTPPAPPAPASPQAQPALPPLLVTPPPPQQAPAPQPAPQPAPAPAPPQRRPAPQATTASATSVMGILALLGGEEPEKLAPPPTNVQAGTRTDDQPAVKRHWWQRR
jgi:nicotinate-nucleotide--dimethylbenzimidazole phosphoribosyltransferase